MSQENVEVVRSFLEPFTGTNVAAIDWDFEAVREMIRRAYSQDIELKTLASGLGSGVDESYRGLDGLVRYLREWLEPFAEYHVEWLDYIEAGDWVVVPTRQWGVGDASGARAELELVHAYKLRDGQIVRLDQYDSVEDALQAAGLSE
ncbi:MAG: nuclear transport factor 2 family protein [Solirubrobacterales bacterium]